MKSPAFQFYSNDFLGGTVATYSLEEVGAYMTLLAFDWNLTGLPVEAEKLARLLRVSRRKFDALWTVVGEQFVERDGRYFNPRLELERAKQAAWREKSAKGGRNHGTKGGSRVVEAMPQPNGNTPSPSSTPVRTKKPSARPAGGESWVAEGVALWGSIVGSVPLGEFGKQLKPMIDLHGWPAVRPDLEKWLRDRAAIGKPCRPAWYAGEVTARLAPKPKILNDDGTLTEYGERITRPDPVPA